MEFHSHLPFAARLAAWFSERDLSAKDIVSLCDILSIGGLKSDFRLIYDLTDWLRERDIDRDELPSLMQIVEAEERPANDRSRDNVAFTADQHSIKARGPKVTIQHDFKKLREKEGLTSYQVAKAVGLAQATIIDVERRKFTTMSYNTAEKLHRYFKLPPPQ